MATTAGQRLGGCRCSTATRGRRAGAQLLPSSLETPRSAPQDCPHLTPASAPAVVPSHPGLPAFVSTNLRLTPLSLRFPRPSYLCPSCGVRQPGLKKSSEKGTPPPPGFEGRRSGTCGGAAAGGGGAGWSVRITRVVYPAPPGLALALSLLCLLLRGPRGLIWSQGTGQPGSKG